MNQATLPQRRMKRIEERRRLRMSCTQKKPPHRPIGRERSITETHLLELLCERESVDHHTAAELTRMTRKEARAGFLRLEKQKLAVCLKRGKPMSPCSPSVWQLRETFERINQPSRPS